MTNQKVIEFLERKAKRAHPCDLAYYDRAIFVLQEKIEREKECKPLTQGFTVIDTKTGEYPDLRDIALNEDWAEGLMYCDMEGFAIQEDGYLILMDECGNCTYAPAGRFEIRLLKEDVE